MLCWRIFEPGIPLIMSLDFLLHQYAQCCYCYSGELTCMEMQWLLVTWGSCYMSLLTKKPAQYSLHYSDSESEGTTRVFGQEVYYQSIPFQGMFICVSQPPCNSFLSVVMFLDSVFWSVCFLKLLEQHKLARIDTCQLLLDSLCCGLVAECCS